MATNKDNSAATIYGTTTKAITDVERYNYKVNITQKLRSGAILEVSSVEQAKIAESAGACCVSVTCTRRMPDPSIVKAIKNAVSIPVMVRSRVGHIVEAQILEAIGVDFIDESEVLGIADECNFVNKKKFTTPFVCGCTSLGEALHRVQEGAVMIRTQGDLTGTGDIAETVKNVRQVMSKLRELRNKHWDEFFGFAREIEAPDELVVHTKLLQRFPVVHLAAGGIVTPADAALMMQLGCDGVFIGSWVFARRDPYKCIRGIVQAVKHYNDPGVLAELSSGLADDIPNPSENWIELR